MSDRFIIINATKVTSWANPLRVEGITMNNVHICMHIDRTLIRPDNIRNHESLKIMLYKHQNQWNIIVQYVDIWSDLAILGPTKADEVKFDTMVHEWEDISMPLPKKLLPVDSPMVTAYQVGAHVKKVITAIKRNGINAFTRKNPTVKVLDIIDMIAFRLSMHKHIEQLSPASKTLEIIGYICSEFATPRLLNADKHARLTVVKLYVLAVEALKFIPSLVELFGSEDMRTAKGRICEFIRWISIEYHLTPDCKFEIAGSISVVDEDISSEDSDASGSSSSDEKSDPPPARKRRLDEEGKKV